MKQEENEMVEANIKIPKKELEEIKKMYDYQASTKISGFELKSFEEVLGYFAIVGFKDVHKIAQEKEMIKLLELHIDDSLTEQQIKYIENYWRNQS